MTDEPQFIAGTLAKLSLKPGDKLVLKVSEEIGMLSRDAIDRMQAQIERFAPGVECAVLAPGLDLVVVASE